MASYHGELVSEMSNLFKRCEVCTH